MKRKLTKQTLEELAKIYPQNAEIMSISTFIGNGSQSNPFTYEEYIAYKKGEISCNNSGNVYYYDASGSIQCEKTIVIDQIDVVGNPNWSYGLSFYDRTWISMYHGLTGNMETTNRPPTGNIDPSLAGGGGGIGEQYFSSIELMDTSKFVGYDVTGDCMTGAKAIMANYGLTPDLTRRVEFVTANGIAATSVVSKAMKIVDECFNKRQPFIAGIRTSNNNNPNDSQYANHFIVITGRGTDSKGMYFTYMETGRNTSHKEDSCNTVKNKFYYNQTTKLWEEDSLCYNTQLSGFITEFRPNK